jgi:hypothetical protein
MLETFCIGFVYHGCSISLCYFDAVTAMVANGDYAMAVVTQLAGSSNLATRVPLVKGILKPLPV